MLPATTDLIAHLQTAERNATIITSLVRAIVRCGGAEDARALGEVFKRQPSDFYHSLLLPVLGRHGDRELAAEIYRACTPGHHEVSPPEVLELLGQLRYEPARPLLARYAFDPSDYYLSKYAVLGLLHFDLDDLAGVIKPAIEATYGQNLFAEFVPALVSKLRHREGMLEKLYESGTKVCSTDCNAGILLGFALCGDEGLPWFTKALFNPAWEAFNTGTGTAFWAYRGLAPLGLRIGELFGEVARLRDEEEATYGAKVLLSLLEMKLRDHLGDHPEPFAAVYGSLFGPPAGGRTLTELAERAGLGDEAERLEELLEYKVYEEAVLGSCGG
ncbi:MAG TPA: hypothetical protein VGE66_06760 [Chitinophagaceae bacterium]